MYLQSLKFKSNGEDKHLLITAESAKIFKDVTRPTEEELMIFKLSTVIKVYGEE